MDTIYIFVPLGLMVVLAALGIALFRRVVPDKKAAERSRNSLASIRRCPKCQQLLAPDARSCRTCGAMAVP